MCLKYNDTIGDSLIRVEAWVCSLSIYTWLKGQEKVARIHRLIPELYQKDLEVPDNPDSVVADLEPDILDSEVKWALKSMSNNKANGGDGIPVELFKILKHDTVMMLHSICQASLENSAVSRGLEKISVHANPKEGQCQRMLQLLTTHLHI